MPRNTDKVQKSERAKSQVFLPVTAVGRHGQDAAAKRLSAIAHEMRSPLGTIHIWVDLLMDGHLDEEAAARALQGIKTSATRLKHIVDKVIDEPGS